MRLYTDAAFAVQSTQMDKIFKMRSVTPGTLFTLTKAARSRVAFTPAGGGRKTNAGGVIGMFVARVGSTLYALSSDGLTYYREIGDDDPWWNEIR